MMIFRLGDIAIALKLSSKGKSGSQGGDRVILDFLVVQNDRANMLGALSATVR